jgi:tetratricopeptide repeat protein 8
MTSGGRLVRLGTATTMQSGAQFIVADKLNAKSVAKKRHIAKAIVDYLIYVESNYRRALDIASEATVLTNYQDWWWKARIGKCQFKMGMIKDAERQFISALKDQHMITTQIELVKVAIRQDQPLKAVELLTHGQMLFSFDTHMLVGIARIHDMLNDPKKSFTLYKQVLTFDNNNVEAIASIASYHFYTDQPEVALRFYKRLL